ncbi:hypothetical protein NQ314_013971 [Rhamnusium bicolor]|uniref:Tyr recombinase domain-containing protein n=1 Tax=Rhamnusium bicolor TaxID=1586634 RepID=A0AAV8X4A3_9CUCU|nr:hypothetical protein NQ314_013971 [Rhamnusium bicolor]
MELGTKELEINRSPINEEACFYMKKSLFRHTKKCSLNHESDITKKRQTSQSDGQTTLLSSYLFKHDELLKSKIFPRMRADDIGLIAKKRSINITNIRRLAKLLQHAQKENAEIKQLIDILRPCHFQLIIAGVNKMAQYNPETENYESPTLAINFGTLVKKCCDLAYVDLLQKKNTNEQRKDLKILKRLIESQWADEVSAQAGANLNQNKWNQEELLPLTSDLKKLNIFLQKTSEESFNKLKTNENDSFAYNTLKEVLYTQLILLNRRRPAEVAQLKVQTFKSIDLENEHTNEFENLRSKFVTDNDFVFHTSGQGFIDGTKVLHRYVNKCKVERPGSITATRLRKHLATITQLLQFSNNDMEQLSKFMGHTLKTHCNVYRMSDKMYQTAKVSKLLLLMTEGGAEHFRGKTLDEIQINLNPIYDNETVTEKIDLDPINQNDLDAEREETLNASHAIQKSLKVHKHKSKKVILDSRQSWSVTQKKTVAEYFSQHIKENKSPKQHEVNEFVNLYPKLFENRKWTAIKAMVYNMYTGKLKYH